MFINKPTVVEQASSYDHEFTRSTMNKIIVISYLDNTDVSIALEEVGAQIAGSRNSSYPLLLKMRCLYCSAGKGRPKN
jgi:hypothetical protein